MRKILLSALIASSVFAAAPASAQGFRGGYQPRPAREIQGDINLLDNQISRASQRRAISFREAASLRGQTIQLQRLFNQFQRDGLDQREVGVLTSQVNAVRSHLRLERRDWDRRRY